MKQIEMVLFLERQIRFAVLSPLKTESTYSVEFSETGNVMSRTVEQGRAE